MPEPISDHPADYERMARALEDIHTLSHVATSTTGHGTSTQWRKVADELAEALRWHEDRRINPTSRGGPALGRYDALNDSLGGSEGLSQGSPPPAQGLHNDGSPDA